jgi:hypothetical protein
MTQKPKRRWYNQSSFELGPDVKYQTIDGPPNDHADVSKLSLAPVGLVIQANEISAMVE